MAKKATGSVKLQIAAGKATPAPPVGPALGQAQINIMEFCKQFNARTGAKELEGLIIPVVITVYSDRTFTFITKTPPAAKMILKLLLPWSTPAGPIASRARRCRSRAAASMLRFQSPSRSTRPCWSRAPVHGSPSRRGTDVKSPVTSFLRAGKD